jgi:hypothetical protein
MENFDSSLQYMRRLVKTPKRTHMDGVPLLAATPTPAAAILLILE